MLKKNFMPLPWGLKSQKKIKAILLLIAIAGCSIFNFTYALNPGAVTIVRSTGPGFTTDSNNPCTDGPRAAYIGFLVTNTSGTTLTNLSISIGSFLPAGFSFANSLRPLMQAVGVLFVTAFSLPPAPYIGFAARLAGHWSNWAFYRCCASSGLDVHCWAFVC